MKKNTYPVAQNDQADAYREIFNEAENPGRVKGINNSPNLVALFPNSPFYIYDKRTASTPKEDRSGLLTAIGYTKTNALTSDDIYRMFSYVIDGKGNAPHVLIKGQDKAEIFTSSKNYNWLYRDKPMSMNFENLDAEGHKQSPNAENAPVGSNQPNNNDALNDKPFWGHANLNVPSSNSLEERPKNANPQLKRGTGGFGTTYAISNRPFAAQEAIGTYFTKNYIDNTGNVDRMNKVAGKSINDSTNTFSADNSVPYAGDKPVVGSNSGTQS